MVTETVTVTVPVTVTAIVINNSNPYNVILMSLLALNRDDEELTGSEDPSVLHSVVANLPAQQAYKEGKNV